MQCMRRVDHVGIRVREANRSVDFYEALGFEVKLDTGFSNGAPIIMTHPSGVVINLLGPADDDGGDNILMDGKRRPAGYTHMALNVTSLAQAREHLAGQEIPLSGELTFGAFSAIFVRDPDRNVIEFNEHPDDLIDGERAAGGFDDHP